MSRATPVSYAQARRRRVAIDWRRSELAVPADLDIHAGPVELSELVPYIDWAPLFHAWDLRGTFPALLDAQGAAGAAARDVYANARVLLERIVADDLLHARAAFRFCAAASDGDLIHLRDQPGGREVGQMRCLRQQRPAQGKPCYSLADFVAPAQTGLADYVGVFAVSTGEGVEELVEGFQRDHDDYGAIMAKALADRLAEALASWLHRIARRFCGIREAASPSARELTGERHRGIRPAPGYPACPDHRDKRMIFALLDAGETVGTTLTESCAIIPAAAVAGFYFNHPAARYFSVGKIGRDQLAARGGDPAEEERWLQESLADS